MFALPLALPFRRHHDWQTVFMLFGIMRLENDQRRHVVIGRRVRRRYSLRLRQWLWTAPATRRRVELSADHQP